MVGYRGRVTELVVAGIRDRVAHGVGGRNEIAAEAVVGEGGLVEGRGPVCRGLLGNDVSEGVVSI